jgi:hypothetical protein
LVSEDSALDVSLALIGGERLRASEAERERYLKRIGAGIAVVLVHIVILAALLTRMVYTTATHPPKEIIFILPPLQNKTQPARPVVVPPVPTVRPDESIPRTITLPPVLPKAQTQTQQQTDIMRELGKELACGAGPWEHLTQAQREACKRNPWKFKKNEKGVIVLDANKAPVQAEEPTSGADAELHIQQTADPCLAAGHTHSECIHKTIFGR